MTDDALDKEPVQGTSDVGLGAVGLLDLTGVHTLDDLVTMGHIRMVGTALVPEAFLARFTTLPIQTDLARIASQNSFDDPGYRPYLRLST